MPRLGTARRRGERPPRLRLSPLRRMNAQTQVYATRGATRRWRRRPRGCWASCGCCRCSTRSGRRSIRPSSRRALALAAPLTLDNFARAWAAAPFARYFVNTVLLVTMVLAAQLVLVTLAAYAFARFEFPGRDILFALVLVQLMIMPDVLIVENYRTMTCSA